MSRILYLKSSNTNFRMHTTLDILSKMTMLMLIIHWFIWHLPCASSKILTSVYILFIFCRIEFNLMISLSGINPDSPQDKDNTRFKPLWLLVYNSHWYKEENILLHSNGKYYTLLTYPPPTNTHEGSAVFSTIHHYLIWGYVRRVQYYPEFLLVFFRKPSL